AERRAQTGQPARRVTEEKTRPEQPLRRSDHEEEHAIAPPRRCLIGQDREMNAFRSEREPRRDQPRYERCHATPKASSLPCPRGSSRHLTPPRSSPSSPCPRVRG